MLDEGGVAGFATIRRCGRSAKIGPLVAPDAEAAWRLIGAAVAALRADRVIVYLPEGNAAFAGRLPAASFVETFRTARMYRAVAPLASSLLQGVGTLELG